MLRQEIERWMRTRRPDLDGVGITGSDSLSEFGFLDSLSRVELLAFLDERFGVEVTEADMVQEDLDTVAGICNFLERKTCERTSLA